MTRRGRKGRKEKVPAAERARGAAYYDGIYKRQQTGAMDGWVAIIREHILPEIVGSVLDIGCGPGALANMVSGEYFGVDISSVAIKQALAQCRNPHAKFAVGDARKLILPMADTVVMLEVLEHIDKPAEWAKIATSKARKRIVVTVPRDMPGVAHLTPRWERKDLDALFGTLKTCDLIGGDTWWLAVKEI